MERIVFLLFLCPGLPKDALTYIVAFNKTIPPLPLFFLTTIARFPAMALTVKMGSSLWEGNWKMTALVVGILILIAVAGGLIRWHHKKKHGKSLWRLEHIKAGRRKNRAACFFAVFWLILVDFSLFNRSCAALAFWFTGITNRNMKNVFDGSNIPKTGRRKNRAACFLCSFLDDSCCFFSFQQNFAEQIAKTNQNPV